MSVTPLNRIKSVRLMLSAGLLLLLAVTTWQWWAVLRARYPVVRAAEALATTVPWFVLLFASAYVTMANANPANFSTHPLTRTDALYFAVTIFATVGFGDITAVSQAARLVVTTQMMLDLLVLGLACACLWELCNSPGGRLPRASRQGRHGSKTTAHPDRPRPGIG